MRSTYRAEQLSVNIRSVVFLFLLFESVSFALVTLSFADGARTGRSRDASLDGPSVLQSQIVAFVNVPTTRGDGQLRLR